MEQKEYEYSLTELMALLDLSHRVTFQKNYLTPALEASVVDAHFLISLRVLSKSTD